MSCRCRQQNEARLMMPGDIFFKHTECSKARSHITKLLKDLSQTKTPNEDPSNNLC